MDDLKNVIIRLTEYWENLFSVFYYFKMNNIDQEPTILRE